MERGGAPMTAHTATINGVVLTEAQVTDAAAQIAARKATLPPVIRDKAYGLYISRDLVNKLSASLSSTEHQYAFLGSTFVGGAVTGEMLRGMGITEAWSPR